MAVRTFWWCVLRSRSSTSRRENVVYTCLTLAHRASSRVLGLCLAVTLAVCSRAESATVDHSGNITAHTTWSQSDVHRISGAVTVNVGIILTIEPGTVVKFNSGARLVINGALSAVGTDADRIVFTSYRDDSAGGDTNGNGASSGQPGDWGNINFQDSATDGLARLEYCEFRFGGSSNNSSLKMYRANVAVVDCLFRDSSRYGVYLEQSHPVISNCEIRDCAWDGFYISSSSPTIEACTIESNRHGIYSASSTPTIRDNQILDNAGWGIYFNSASTAPVITGNTITGNVRSARLPGSAVPNSGDGNTLAPNQINGLWIRGNTRSSDLRFERLYAGESRELSTYWIEHQFTIANGAKWTVDPGVTVKLAADAYLVIYGALSAVGTADSQIAFTSQYDDTIGGDLNLDGYATSPSHGDWQSIYFDDQASEAECALEFCRIRYGGRNNSASVYTHRCSFPIRDCEISNSYSSGVRSYQSNLTLEDNEVFVNNGHGILLQSSGSHTVSGGRIFANLSSGVRVESSVALSATACEIFGNAGHGISSSSNQAIVATGNWWGATDGPSGDGPGSGDQISGNIDASGFLASGSTYSFYNAGPGTGEGTIPLPTVTQGTDTSEFGGGASTRMLYDLDEVILDYAWQDASNLYDVFVTYYNPDDTSGVGGSRQSLRDGVGTEIHGSRLVSRTNRSTLRYALPSSSHAASDLRLRFVKENGYRAVVSTVWIVGRKNKTDTTAPSSTIVSPSADENISGSTFFVEGTTDDGAGSGLAYVEVGVDGGSGIVWRPATQMRSDGSWAYRWPLPGDGPRTIYARAVDLAGNVAGDGSGTDIVVNRGAAASVTGISAYDTPSDDGESITILWVLSADDGFGADDVATYEIERRTSGAGDFSVIGSVSAGVASFEDVAASDGVQYDYRIVTVDDAGNRSTSSIYGPVLSIDNTGGTDSTPPEEITNLAAIAGNGFAYLTWTRSSDSALDLVDQLLDISVDGGANWGVVGPGYVDGGTTSLGKEAGERLVDGLANGTGFLFRLRVTDSSGNVSVGVVSSTVTPSATAVQTVSGTISSDTTWAAGVYRVTNHLTVNSGVTLTILPSVIVKMNSNIQFSVRGSLVAVGSLVEPIIFTSYNDDSAGGDSNGDGESSGSAGTWGRLNAYSGSNVRLEHCSVRFSGSSGTSAVYVSSATLTMKSSEVLDSSSSGVYTTSSSVQIEDCTIARHPQQGIYLNSSGGAIVRNTTVHDCGNGIYVSSSTPTIDGCHLHDNGNYGLYFSSATNAPGITGNTIRDNFRPARLPFYSLPAVGSGNTLTPNTREVLEIVGNSLTRPTVLGEGGVNVYYQVTGTTTIATGVQLEVPAGTIWKFGSATNMNVDGALLSRGTAGNEVVFTSYRDDSHGGDTNGGGPSSGSRGDWGRIYFQNSVIDFLCRFEHTIVRYGGSSSNSSVYTYRANVTFENCLIEESSRYGMHIEQSSVLAKDSTFRNCGWDGLYVSSASPTIETCTIEGNRHGIYSASSTPRIRDNQIIGNSGWGIYFNSASAASPITGNTITGNFRSARLPASAVPNSGDGNTLAPNTVNGLWIRGNTRNSNLRFERLYPGEARELSTYWIEHQFTIAPGVKWTVDPGVTVKLASDAYLVIRGALNAVGTASQRIAFTSQYDDTLGGDLNLDGANTSPAHGDWQSIYFDDQVTDADCVLEHCVIRYGGRNNSASVYAYRCSFPIRNCEISNSYSSGLRGYQSNLTLENNEVFANNSRGLYLQSTGTHTMTGGRVYANLSHGIHVDGSVALSANGAEIFGNAGQGLASSSNQAIDATGNWWGAADGPGGDGPGTGDQISGTVDASGFLVTGSRYGFYNAGPGIGDGSIPAPVVTQGTDTTEFGTGTASRMLYDLDEVVLDYPWQDASRVYDLFVTYYNPDDTSGVGGSRQSLSDGVGNQIHGSQLISRTTVSTQRFALPTASHTTEDLQLRFIRESGYRAVVSAIWIVERAIAGDTSGPTSTVTFPLAGSQLSGSTVFVEGTTDDDAGSGVDRAEVGVDAGSGIVWRSASQFRGDGTFSYRWVLPTDGVYTLYARAYDRAGNLGPLSAAVSVTVNRTGPGAVTDLSAYDTPADDGGSISISWTLSPDDGGGSNDVTTYAIERRESGSSSFAQIGSVAAGIGSFEDSSVDDGVQYDYRVATIDLAGNRTSSPSYGPVISIDNSGGTDTTTPEEITQLSAIAGNQFVFLTWARSVDTALDLVDQWLDISVDGGTTWGINDPAYDDGNALSLGKESRDRLLEGLTNGTGYRFRLRVVDSSGNISAGVVSDVVVPNSTAVTNVSGALSGDTTWAAGVYRVTSNVTINGGASLTILPGVIVKFDSNVQLIVNGTLNALGTPGSPIVFTSYNDDSAGGDSNGDGPSSGTAGYWGRITCGNGSNTQMNSCIVRYSGRTGTSTIYGSSATINLNGCEIVDGNHSGIYTYNSSVQIVDCTIARHAAQGVYFDRSGAPVVRGSTIHDVSNGIYVNSSDPTIDGNVLRDNRNYGIYFTGARNAPPITNNTIRDNLRPARLPFYSIPGDDSGNVIGPNVRPALELWGNSLTRPMTLGGGGVNVYYLVSGTATVATGVRLTVPAGIVWKFASGTNFDVNGALFARGTESQKVVFTSYRDDRYGGDTNANGPSEGRAGDWGRIYFTNSVIDFLARLEHTVIAYGGAGSNTSLYAYRANITLESCEISHSSRYGVYLEQAHARVEGTDVHHCGWDGIYVSSSSPTIVDTTSRSNRHGLYAASSTPTIRDSQFLDNSGWGIYFNSAHGAPPITGCTVTGNFRPMMVPATAMPNSDQGNVLSPNVVNGIYIRGNHRSTDLRLEALYSGEAREINTYWISGSLRMNAGAKLTVDPGVVVKFDSTGYLEIYGALEAVGTAQKPVVFTSDQDDEYGGDLNYNGYGTSPTNGRWYSIYFADSANDAECAMERCVVRYGGGNNSASIYTYRANFPIRHCEISNSSSSGLRAYQSNLILEGNDFYWNSSDGLLLQSNGTHSVTGGRFYGNASDGIEAQGSVVLSVTGAEFFANFGQGLRSSSNQAVDAIGNWWGAIDGPAGDGPGSGDQIVGNIDASSFLLDGSEYSFFDAGGSAHEAYGLGFPNLSGDPSTQWGGGALHSFLYDLDDQLITGEYVGLASGAPHRLYLAYLNRDANGGAQRLTDIDGTELHPRWNLPTSNPAALSVPVPASSIDDGNLQLKFEGISGLRTVVGGVMLLRDASPDTTPPVVTLDAPTDGTAITSSRTVVSGSFADTDSGVLRVEVGVEVLGSGSPISWRPATTLSSMGHWRYYWGGLATGTYRLHARAVDRSGNRALAPQSPEISIDRDGPAAVSGLFAQGLSGFNGAIRLTWELSRDDGAGSDDVVRYEIFRRPDSSPEFAKVGEVVAGAAQYDDTTITAGSAYFYYVRTVDESDNGTNSGIVGPTISTGEVDSTPPEDVTSFVATPTQVDGANVSMMLTWTGSANSAGDLVDQRLAISLDGVVFGSNHPTYDDGSFLSLGRSTRRHQIVDLTSGQEYTFRLTTVDEIPNESAGATVSVTPTGAATEYVTLGGNLTGDTILEAGVYYVSSQLVVPAVSRLTLRPGVVFKFRSGQQLVIYGELRSLGTPSDPVYYTSFNDDSVGGDTNGNGPSSGSAGYWRQVYFENATASRMESSIVRFAGSGNASVRVWRTYVAFSDCEILDGSTTGLYQYQSSILFEDCLIARHPQQGLYLDSTSSPTIRGVTSRECGNGLYNNGSTPTIVDSDFLDNGGWGIYFTRATGIPPIRGCTVTGNDRPLFIPASGLPDETNTLTPNSRPIVHIRGNQIASDVRLRSWSDGTPDELSTYVVHNARLTIPTFRFLTIDPGVVVKFVDTSTGIDVHGALVAQGSVDEKMQLPS